MFRFSLWAALLGLTVMGFATGCRDDDTSVVAQPLELTVDADVTDYYEDDYYTWDTALDQARVEFRVRHFHEGSVRLRILDDDDNTVFDRIYWWDDDYYWWDDEFLDISSTESGVPGSWLVWLEYHDFTGHLYLTLD